ncbi:hypothetical protein EMUCRT_0539 [Ehrlichia cf. muris str. EmCRT]|uniref:Uncharacterized protein n=1 Tax=Ehrlichia cf. muris str. EmCRT TaxID=1359167 RepID=A0A0F3NFD2_9RICK|nr:hypothetical protein EMUCRT_0539 [Ehrlichia cf. muris str. EmCRT]
MKFLKVVCKLLRKKTQLLTINVSKMYGLRSYQLVSGIVCNIVLYEADVLVKIG